MGQTDLVVFDVHLEIALVPVCYERRIGQPVWKPGVYGLLASRLQLIYIGKDVILEYPVPVQLLSHGGTSLVCSHDWREFYPFPYFLVCRIRLGTVLLEDVLYGSLAYLPA